MDNDYLHKINLESLSRETRLSEEQIAKLAGISDPKNLGKWGQGKPNGSRPNYNAFVRLLEKGASVETLFGVQYKGASVSPEAASDQNQIREEVVRVIAEMKAKGEL